ncbi:MAG TPA: hypothetical protein PKN32_13065 [Bacteroidales bacterium]|nr:hypothetical protein [Bacteroidales bacterium]
MTNENNNKKLLRYLNRQMTDEELSAFEQEIAEDEFLLDALEGFKNSGALPEDLEIIKPEIFPTKQIKVKISLIFAGIAASLIIVLMYFIVFEHKPLNKRGNTISKSIFDLNINSDSVQFQDSLSTHHQQTNEFKIYVSELRDKPEKVIVPESIPPLHINMNIKIQNRNQNLALNNYYQYNSNHYYTYINNYKVVNYIYDKRINTKHTDIPTHFLVPDEQSDDLAISKTNCNYDDFLRQTLNQMDEKNFEEAIQGFDIILSQYPSDVNAIFYKALCLYEINQNDNSLKLFELTLSNRINTFHQESKWYKSMILKEQKQYAATEKVLLEIINDNGYYGVQAKSELDDLYKYYLNE